MKKAKRRKQSNSCDLHHLFWTRKAWGDGYARELRFFWYCQVWIPRKTLHRAIHSSIKRISPLNSDVSKMVLKRLYAMELSGTISGRDSIKKRLEVLIEVMKAVDSSPSTMATIDALGHQLKAINEYKQQRKSPV